ncbi:hypothetical protein [Haloarcula sebkhae]|uniref:Uncharacterized protein n=2 Tax=Haloarcula sebkhae TaxID=932660 RepID=A0ACC6VS92_9EURY|nr:hypothetical protein [Haloarcula sebkhae]GGK79489.1 hypothetical protein GCM10009067_34740 [Haloarcula sebkhae]
MPEDHEQADSQHHDTEEERRRRRDDQQDEEQKTQPRSPDQSGDKSAGEDSVSGIGEPVDYTPGDLTVPDVPLEDMTGAESVNPVTTISNIEETSRDGTVPELPLRDISIETTSVDIVTRVPDIAAAGKEWQIPLVQLGSASTVQFQPSSFDTEIRKPPKRRQQTLSVPLYRRVSTPRVRFVPVLDETLDEMIRRRLERLISGESDGTDIGEIKEQDDETEESTASEAETSTAGSTAASGHGSHTSGAGEEVPTFQDIIYGGDGAATTADGTTIVLFNEAVDNSYVGSYLTLCRRIHREANGGHPEFQPINELDEINKREIEKWLDAEKKVIFIDLDDRERRIDEAKLREKLEATLGKFGFIVFKATDPDVVDEYRDTLDGIKLESPHPPLNVVEVSPRQPGFEVEQQMAELCWGNLDLVSGDIKIDEPAIERPTGPGVFDDLFNRYAPTEFEDYLDDIKTEERGLFKRFTTENRGHIQGKEQDDADSGESPLHYNIKVYIVRYLVQQLRESGEDIDELQDLERWIETETEREGVIPDVFFSGQQQEAYEIETLFSGGQNPTNKIDRTINKYDKNGVDVDKIHIVLENFTFLRHLDELSNIQHHYAHRTNEEGELLIQFETLDFQNGGLLPLKALIDKVTDLNDK